MFDSVKHKLMILLEQAKVQNSSSNMQLYEEHRDVRLCLKQAEHHSMSSGIVMLNKVQPYYVVGDLHSDLETLVHFLEKINFYERVRLKESFQIVFLGDYVDRGANHMGIMALLMALKLDYPDYICLLRGNHDGGKLLEDGSIKLPYRIPDDDNPLAYFPKYLEDLIYVQKKADFQLLELFLQWFDTLPYLAFIGSEKLAIQCVHGGIIKPEWHPVENYDDVVCLADLTRTASRCEELFWSDPYSGEGERNLEKRRFKFTAENYFSYKDKVGIKALIRGHEVVEEGVKSHFDGSLYTLFSTGQSSDSYYKTVKPFYILIDGALNIEPHAIYC